MRGYVITILSVSLIMILVALSMSLRNGYLSMERALIEPLPLTYAAFLMDSVAYQFNSIVGPQIAINQSNASIVVSINDTLHIYNHSTDIAAYGTFINVDVGNITASNISANFTNISGGMMRVFIDEDYVYTNNHATREMLFTSSGGTNATSYNISIGVAGVRGSVTPFPFNASGSLNLTISYTDLNGTGTESGMVLASQQNQFMVTYANGSNVKVTVGPTGGNAGSLDIVATGTDANVSFAAGLPPLNAGKERGYAYDATVSYAQGNVAYNHRIGK